MDNSKSNFITGLSVGIAIVSVGAMVMMSLNKNEVVANTNDSNSNSNNNAQVANNNNYNPPPSQPSSPPPPPSKVDIQVTNADRIKGNKDAPITIIEFSDIECPFCARFHPTMQQAVADYPDKVRWVYKHFPLDSIHPYARKASEASECAGDQGKFWEYLDKLFENQSQIKPAYLNQLAGEMGLNQSEFDSCLETGKFAGKVNDDYNDGLKAGVRGTPGNFINGQSIPGAVPYSQIKAMIDNLL